MVQTTTLGQNDLIPNWILAFASQNGPFWAEVVHFGPFRSANRTLAIPGGELSLLHFGVLWPFVSCFLSYRRTDKTPNLVHFWGSHLYDRNAGENLGGWGYEMLPNIFCFLLRGL